MMPLLRLSLPALCAATMADLVSAQSTMMTALDGAVPAPTIERTTAALTRGLASVWTDPTADPHATGAFFSIHHASYTSVSVFHGAAAFRLGPRWSVAGARTRPTQTVPEWWRQHRFAECAIDRWVRSAEALWATID